MEHTVFSLAAVGLAGIACQWLAWRVQLPAILFLLLVGILAGPVLNWLQPDALLGELLFPFVSLAVAVILFEGSLTLRLRDIRGLEAVVRKLTTTGLLTTWIITSVATHLLVDFPWELAFLFGALVVVTGPTVIVPMLRTVRPNSRISEVLRWEAIVIDPLGAVLAVLVYEFLIARGFGEALGRTFATFGLMLGVGLTVGAVFGQALGWLLRSRWLPEYLHAVTTLAVVCSGFALSNLISPESGLLAVTVLGMWLANMKGVPLQDVLGFKESLSLLLVSALFILLAARLPFDRLVLLGWGGLGVFLTVQFVARPVKVLVATAGSSLSWRERSLLAWIAPRGIIAAAVSALFGPRLVELGFAQADLLVPLTFCVIIGTVVLQSASAGLLARLLNVAEPAPKGVLIVGASLVARTIGGGLQRAGYPVLLADAYWRHVEEARREGLNVYYGHPVSDEADRRLDLVGIGQLLALSPEPDLNRLATLRYRHEFGRAHVYRLADTASPMTSESGQGVWGQDQILFSEEMNYSRLEAFLVGGAQIREHALSMELDWSKFLEDHPHSIPLFAIDERSRLRFFVAARQWQPTPKWNVFALHPVIAEPAARTSQSREDRRSIPSQG